MTNLEIEFFEEYRAVDIICKDMFQAEKGVTEYIEQMEKYDSQGFHQIDNWNAKYKMLKHLRWLRNQIAHEAGAPELEQNDLIELQRFHKQLLKQMDPLTVLLKSMSGNKSSKKRTSSQRSAKYSTMDIEVHNKSFGKSAMWYLVIVLLIVGLYFLTRLLIF